MIDVLWTGWDQSAWSLRNPPMDRNVWLTDAGVEGLLEPDLEVFTRTSALLDGQTVTGWKAKPREILLPIDISSPTSGTDWYALQLAFNKTMRVDRPGMLTVTDPYGLQRTIQARWDGKKGPALSVDPTHDMGLYRVYGLVGDGSWWLGPEVYIEFLDASNAPRDFYAGPGRKGPPFYLGTGLTTGGVTIDNPGDVDVWPIWEFTGPFEGFEITLDGSRIVSTTSVDVGYRLSVDTRPGQKAAWLDRGPGTPRVNVTDTLDQAKFARISDGDSVPATVILDGTGKAGVRFQPRYFNAVG